MLEGRRETLPAVFRKHEKLCCLFTAINIEAV
jgi:hypothetical protein